MVRRVKSDGEQQHIPVRVQLEPAGWPVASSENFAVKAKEKIRSCSETCASLQPWSVRGMWEACCHSLRAPHICPMLHALIKQSMHVNDTLYLPAEIMRTRLCVISLNQMFLLCDKWKLFNSSVIKFATTFWHFRKYICSPSRSMPLSCLYAKYVDTARRQLAY